jgi:hypothetical protein
MVTEQDGILVNTQNERQLTNAMLRMMEYVSNYPPQQIREHGRKYSYAVVGRQLVDLYQQVMA